MILKALPGLLSFSACLLFAQTAHAQTIGTVAEASGVVVVERGGTSQKLDAGNSIELGDKVTTGENGKARLVFIDETVLTVGPDSAFSVPEYGSESVSHATPPSSESEHPQGRRIRVAQGNTLYSLMREFYGAYNPRLLEVVKAANPALTDAATISAGQVLYFPPIGLETSKGIASSNSVINVARGRVRALVSDEEKRGGTFQITTETALCTVRGTEFIVFYNPTETFTDVVGVSGEVRVQNTLARTDPGVLIAAGEITGVRRGAEPVRPQKLTDKEFRQYMHDLDFIAAAGMRGVFPGNAVIRGQRVPDADRAEVVVTESPVVTEAESQNSGISAETTPTVADLTNQPIEAVVGGLEISF